MDIGNNIKKLRKSKGLTQTQLAQKINKGLRMLQKYESNEVTPTLDILFQLGEIFDINPLLLIKPIEEISLEDLGLTEELRKKDYLTEFIKELAKQEEVSFTSDADIKEIAEAVKQFTRGKLLIYKSNQN